MGLGMIWYPSKGRETLGEKFEQYEEDIRRLISVSSGSNVRWKATPPKKRTLLQQKLP